MRRLWIVLVVLVAALLAWLALRESDPSTLPVDEPETVAKTEPRKAVRPRVRRERVSATVEDEARESDASEEAPGTVRVPVDVRVVDADGAPVAGIRVGHYWSTGLGSRLTRSARTDEAGAASLLLLCNPSSDGRSDFVGLAEIGAGHVRVKIDAREPPSEPVVLEIPPTGSVEVRVEGGATPLPEDLVVSLLVMREHGPSSPPRGVQFGSVAKEPVVDGCVAFPRVALDWTVRLELVDRAGRRVPVTVRRAGPRSAGEVVSVAMPVGVLRPVLTGRLIKQDGTPVPKTPIRGQLQSPGEILGRPFATTDENGVFQFILEREPGPAPELVFDIKAIIGRTLKGLATIDLPDVLRSGENAIGDVVYPSTLLTGKVTDADGKPIERAMINVMEPRRSGRSVAIKIEFAETGADGRFVLRGSTDLPELILRVQAEGYCLDRAPVFPPGAADVSIVMSKAGGLAGSVKLPAGVRSDALRILVRGDAQRHLEWATSVGQGTFARQSNPTSFEAPWLSPGTATVVFFFEGREFHRVERLRIVAGETNRDPRLQKVDLGVLLSFIDVLIVDPKGKPVPRAVVRHRPHGSADGWSGTATSRPGVARILGEKEGLDLMVVARAFRSAVLENVRSDVKVQLESAPPCRVDVRLSATSPLPPPPFTLAARLQWAGPLGSSAVPTPLSFDPRDSERPVRSPDHRITTDRKAAIDIWEPGRYRVELVLTHPKLTVPMTAVPTKPTDPIVTIAGDGVPVAVELEIDQADLDRLTGRGR